MNRGDDDSPLYIATSFPYCASIASLASSSSASVWSSSSSQASDDASVTSSVDSDPSDCCYGSSSYPSTVDESCPAVTTVTTSAPKHKLAEPAQPRHPRRTSSSSRAACPPPLVRQCDRKVNFVDSLVDSSAQIVEAIWPLSSVACRSEMGSKGVLPLRTFIQETLRRSRTSYSTLQVALYYLILIKPHVPSHDFTMEQPDDAHAVRALQCGRRMFLAALILASKYLQDRNYSTRAWSKISGLNTLEINQNEMAFLLAVNWRIHITDAVFQRWTDIVLKYTTTLPPSPGSSGPRLAEPLADWKSIIPKLTPELDNLDEVATPTSPLANVKTIDAASLRSLPPLVVDHATCEYGSHESTPTPKYYTPNILEPSPSSIFPPARVAPALGLLPTPRLTPQSTGYSTPAVSAASYMLCKSSMSYAMAQASTACAAQATEKWQSSSPQAHALRRRSSLANSVSSMSSPESMVSDTSSRSSRSSSISSASSLMSAPLASKLDVQARCRYAKRCSEKMSRTIIAPVPEGFCYNGPTSSPESYTGPVGKDFLDLSLDTPVAKRDADMEYEDAARALQELHSHPRSAESPNRVGAKRSRAESIDNSLQENVREILSGQYQPYETNWSDDLVRSRATRIVEISPKQIAIRSTSVASLGRKRVCCATEAARDLSASGLHPAIGSIGGPGMWEGILN